MSAPKVGYAQGKCGRCGKTYVKKRPAFPIICDCWKYCPLCGKEMTLYTPDLTPSVYEAEKGLRVIRVCLNHTPSYYSKDVPVEIGLK